MIKYNYCIQKKILENLKNKYKIKRKEKKIFLLYYQKIIKIYKYFYKKSFALKTFLTFIACRTFFLHLNLSITFLELSPNFLFLRGYGF